MYSAEKAAAFGADFILAVGGGSVIDTAKAVGLALANPGVDLWDFWTKGRKPAGCTPVGAVLTLIVGDGGVLQTDSLGTEPVGDAAQPVSSEDSAADESWF